MVHGIVRVWVVGAGGSLEASYIHQAESDLSGNTFRHAIGFVFARVVRELLEADDAGFVVEESAGLLAADPQHRGDFRKRKVTFLERIHNR